MFKTRCISAVFLVIIALATLILGGPVTLGVLMIISLIAFFELTKACKIHTDKINALEMIGVLAIITYYAGLEYMRSLDFFVPWLVFFFILLLFVYVFGYPKFDANQVMSTLFCVIYAPVMFSFVYLTREYTYGLYMVFMIFISSWISDTFAYLTGMTIGKHKLAPVLSPKKSIEGSIGGIIGAGLVGALYGWYLSSCGIMGNNQMIVAFAIIGAAGSVVSQIGDLAASAIKRNHDIKDYGKLIPGHGGIMDRFDSVIVTAPIIYILTTFFIK